MSSKEENLSVDESNALREKLGLRKLNDDAAGSRHETVYEDADPREKKAKSKHQLQAEKDRADQEKTRKKLTKGKGIVDNVDEDAGDWVAKMRAGGGAKPAQPKKEKESKDKGDGMKNMRVRHDVNDFEEGMSVELTLADAPILGKDGQLLEDDGELVNAGLASQFAGQRAQHIQGQTMDMLQGQSHAQKAKNLENRSLDGQSTLLSQYDDPARLKQGFTLGAGGTADGSADVAAKLEMLTKQAVSLEQELKFQSDYSRDVVTRKPKKKIRKRGEIEAEKAPVKKIQLPDPGADSDEDGWLYEQLARQRKLARREQQEERGAEPEGVKAAAAQVEALGSGEVSSALEVLHPMSDKVLTGTTEFCTAVDTAAEKLDKMRGESYSGTIMYKQQSIAKQKLGARKKGKTGEEGIDEEAKEEAREILSEDLLDNSTASALQFLRSRNDILMDQESHRTSKGDNKPMEMNSDIRLEARDEFGRIMTPKESFRQISWVFHGKRPGAKNQTRRLLRLENELKLKSEMSKEDVALPTMRALKSVQGSEAKAHIVLTSGAA